MFSRKQQRRGVSNVQWLVVAGVICLACVATVSWLGTSTSTDMNQTASDVAAPSSLVDRFGTTGDSSSGDPGYGN